MPQQNDWVVYDPNSGLYLVSYNVGNPPSSLFGSLKDALLFTEAQSGAIATAIGHGTVGTRKP